MTALLVILGAALGAPARYLVDRAVQSRHGSGFPWGTFTVNVVGCFVLGFLTGLPFGTGVLAFAGVGFCGALTTYSTFGYETLRLLTSGARLLALLNVVASLVAGLGAAYVGLAFAQLL
jgi:fluoride exporter